MVIIAFIMLIYCFYIYVPAGKVPNVETGSITSKEYLEDHVYVIRKDGCEYVVILVNGSGITHHGACDNVNCIYKK